MADVERYVVRGAKMQCNCGSHPRKINLPVSHGSYVNNKPMMNESDHIAETNIMSFGICNSPSNSSNETIYLISEAGATISGKPCLPILLNPWLMAKEKTKVEGKAALTTESQLICANNGVITFVSDGQHDE